MPITKSTDILIVGAGPAGATASMWLSANKVPHTIIDRSIFPRDKVCGDALSSKVFSILSQLEPDISEQLNKASAEALDTHGVTFGSPNGKEVTLPFDRPSMRQEEKGKSPIHGFVMKREHFDNFLFKKLNPTYADIRQNVLLKHISHNAVGTVKAVIECNGELEELNPKIVIAADGERSVVNKELAKHKNADEHFAVGVRAYYENVTGFNSLNAIELHYINEALPGYLWLFPMPNGGCNAGIVILSSDSKKNKRNIRKEMIEILATHPKIKDRFANAAIKGKIVGWGLPLGSKKRKISGNNYMLTGDAGSLIDPLTGEGIGNAIISGKYAAVYAMEALTANDFSESFFQQRYDKMIYHKLWKEFQISYGLQRMMKYPWLVNIGFKLMARSAKMQDVISMMFVDIDLRKQLKSPLFYLKMILGR